MNHDTFTKLFDESVSRCRELLVIKGGEYAGSEDRLANFKRGAELTGCTPLQCLFIYMSKHYDALATYVRDDANGEVRVRSEPISGRVDDLINYGFLLQALLVEELTPAVESELTPPITAYACPQLKIDDGSGLSWTWVNLTEEQYFRWFKAFATPGTVSTWEGRKIYAHRALPSHDWQPL